MIIRFLGLIPVGFNIITLLHSLHLQVEQLGILGSGPRSCLVIMPRIYPEPRKHCLSVRLRCVWGARLVNRAETNCHMPNVGDAAEGIGSTRATNSGGCALLLSDCDWVQSSYVLGRPGPNQEELNIPMGQKVPSSIPPQPTG